MRNLCLPEVAHCSDSSKIAGRQKPGEIEMAEQKPERSTYPRESRNDTTIVNPSENFPRGLTLSLCVENERCRFYV